MSAPVARERRIARVVESLNAGQQVVLISDEKPGGHAELMLAAELTTTRQMAFVVRHSSGYIRVALPPLECNRLDLPAMATATSDGPAYTVSVDGRVNTSTGISAHDRAETARALADPQATSASFTRPGHVVPIRASAEVDNAGSIALLLNRLAGLRPAAVLAEMVGIADPTRMATGIEAVDFARNYDLAWLSSRDLEDTDSYIGVEIVPGDTGTTEVDSAVGPLTRRIFRDSISGQEHSAIFRSGGRSAPGQPLKVVGVRYADSKWNTLGLPWYVSGQPLLDMLGDLAREEAGVVLFLGTDRPSPVLEKAVVTWLSDPSTIQSTANTSRIRM